MNTTLETLLFVAHWLVFLVPLLYTCSWNHFLPLLWLKVLFFYNWWPTYEAFWSSLCCMICSWSNIAMYTHAWTHTDTHTHIHTHTDTHTHVLVRRCMYNTSTSIIIYTCRSSQIYTHCREVWCLCLCTLHKVVVSFYAA